MVVLFSLRGFVFWARSGKAELAVLYTFEVYVTIVYPLMHFLKIWCLHTLALKD